jgi:hypothetical protein
VKELHPGPARGQIALMKAGSGGHHSSHSAVAPDTRRSLVKETNVEKEAGSEDHACKAFRAQRLTAIAANSI